MDFLHVEEFGGVLESHREFLIEDSAVLFELFDVFLLEHENAILLLLLDLVEHFVPLLVELLVLFNVSVFNFFTLLGLLQEHFFSPLLQILLLELNDSVFGHFSLYPRIKI